jgi:hypothetical protein
MLMDWLRGSLRPPEGARVAALVCLTSVGSPTNKTRPGISLSCGMSQIICMTRSVHHLLIRLADVGKFYLQTIYYNK